MAAPGTRAERELRVLREVAGAVNESLRLPQVLDRILAAMRDAFDFRHSLVLLPVDATTLEVRASLGYPESGEGARVTIGEGPIGVVARRRKPMRMLGMRAKVGYAAHVGGGERVPLPGLRDAASSLVVPMLAGDELVGVLAVESTELVAFEPDDERLVTTVANLAAAAIRNARLYHDLLETNRSGERFVPHEFVRFLEKESLKDLDRGENVRRAMTVLFSDLRSFTSIAEALDPGSTFGLLNQYFATAVPPIQAHRGFVDKFIGDAIMALFDRDDADEALAAALAQHAALDALNEARVGRAPLRMGVGLHTGDLVLGVVGSEDRLSCTVYGDSVNLASRVEALTKVYGARVLLTDATVAALRAPERGALRLVDRVRVKGKNEPVALWEALAAWPAEEQALRAPHDALAIAREPYERGEFRRAIPAVAGLVARYPHDPALAVLLQRCIALAEDAPSSWDGAFRLDRK